MDSSSNELSADSGVSSKRRKITEEENTNEEITATMLREISLFDGQASYVINRIKRSLQEESATENYRRLYRLYITTTKAINTLQTERNCLDNTLNRLPLHAKAVLGSEDDDSKVWSEFFYKNPSPTKIKKGKTSVSPTTSQIGSLLHSIGAFYGLTAEAVCSNKLKKENNDRMHDLLITAEDAISRLQTHRNNIYKVLMPFIEKERRQRDANPETSHQI